VQEAAGDPAAARHTWQQALELTETVNPAEVPRLRAKLRTGTAGDRAGSLR
jgi:hypothetical protein